MQRHAANNMFVGQGAFDHSKGPMARSCSYFCVIEDDQIKTNSDFLLQVK